MYRILSASKDAYITNKYIAGSRSLGSNVGQAGTLDLFKLYNETRLTGVTSSITELTRLLVQFDYSELQLLTGSILDFTSGSFRASVVLKDVYGGQTTPSNFTVELLPLSKSFDEGRGTDVVAFRDLDATNWLTASLSPVVTWSQPGAAATGSLGEDVDVITSGNLGTGIQGLGASQKFARGDENLKIDVTHLVSASLAGIIPNNGFRLSFSQPEEEDTVTRFAKRFGSRHVFNKNLRPELVVEYGDIINDPGSRPFFDTSSSLYLYNRVRGQNVNIFSGSAAITGSNSLIMTLISSKSVKFVTSSWSPSHSASINYVTRSLLYVSRSYSGSQFSFGTIPQTGIYFAPFHLSTIEDQEVRSFVSGASEVYFDVFWTSLDQTVQYARNGVTMRKIEGQATNAMDINLVVNMTNLKDEYNSQETDRIRVFASDYNQELPGYRVPVVLDSVIVPDMRWRVIKAFTKEIVIPWSPSTRMSTDKDGMYFDFYFRDLPVNEVYEFELLCVTDIGRDLSITNRGFRFKVIP